MVESITRGEKMKDFPMFTTEFGIASLILREIPYRGEAFILIQDTQKQIQATTRYSAFGENW